MNFRKLARFASIFLKSAQALPDGVSSTNTVSSDETSAFDEHAKMTASTADLVHQWAQDNIGEVGTEEDQNLINIYNFSRDLKDSAANFYSKASEFAQSTDVNKTIVSIDSLFNTLMGNYNKLTDPGLLDDAWVADAKNQPDYKGTNLGEAMDMMQQSMKYMEEYINKYKNQEANSEAGPSLPS